MQYAVFMKLVTPWVILVALPAVAESGDPTVGLADGTVRLDVSRDWDTRALDSGRLRSTNARLKIALELARGPLGDLDCIPDNGPGPRELELDGWRGEEVETSCRSGNYAVVRTLASAHASYSVSCSSTEPVGKIAIATYRTRCRDAFARVHFAKVDEQVRAPAAADLAKYTKDLGAKGQLVATIETSLGALHCELFADKAPMTVANFVGLARGMKAWTNPRTGAVERGKPFYDGLTFHRVIPGFMIQGGDPLGIGTGGPGYRFDDEDNDLAMGPGALAMANAGQNTNGCQFFIMDGARPDLEHRHTNFGLCKELDVIKAIARVEVDNSDRPTTPVTVKHITFRKR